MTNIVDTKSFPGGTTGTMQLSAGPNCKSVQIGFSRTTGVVTVRARGNGAASFSSMSNNAVNLANDTTFFINGAITELEFADAGSGPFTATVISFT